MKPPTLKAIFRVKWRCKQVRAVRTVFDTEEHHVGKYRKTSAEDGGKDGGNGGKIWIRKWRENLDEEMAGKSGTWEWLSSGRPGAEKRCGSVHRMICSSTCTGCEPPHQVISPRVTTDTVPHHGCEMRSGFHDCSVNNGFPLPTETKVESGTVSKQKWVLC